MSEHTPGPWCVMSGAVYRGPHRIALMDRDEPAARTAIAKAEGQEVTA